MFRSHLVKQCVVRKNASSVGKVLGLALALALALMLLPDCASAAQSTNKSPASAKAAVQEKKPRPIPFHGTVKAIDKNAKTLTVGSRVFQLTAKTRVNKEGKTAGLESGTIGERVSGSYWKADDGKLLANSIYFGEKQSSTKKAEPKKAPTISPNSAEEQ